MHQPTLRGKVPPYSFSRLERTKRVRILTVRCSLRMMIRFMITRLRRKIMIGRLF